MPKPPEFLILSVLPRPCVTEAALFLDEKQIWAHKHEHAQSELSKLDNLNKSFMSEVALRVKCVEEMMLQEGCAKFDAVISTGGLLAPVRGGTYKVTDAMIKDLEYARYGLHSHNMGAFMARALSENFSDKNSDKIPAFAGEPMSADELIAEARMSGIREIERKSVFHAAAQRGAAKRAAKKLNVRYEDVNMIAAHIGTGASVGAHHKGRVIEVNNAVEGEGPFSMVRSGGLPAGELINLCFSGKYDMNEIKNIITKEGGVLAHLGTANIAEIMTRIEDGDERARLVMEAMAYGISKEIAARAAVLRGEVSAVVVTGPLSDCDFLTSLIKEYTGWIAPFYALECSQLEAMAEGALNVLRKKEEALIYEEVR